jgi:hypothetical protein
MKKNLINYIFISLCLALVVACQKEKDYDYIPTPKPLKYGIENIEEIFGFYGQKRYAYCPSIAKEEDGTTHLFFCGTQNMILVDNIYHLRINPDGTQTPAKVVLSPGAPGAWDDQHTCDPSVVKGNFNMGGKNYQYALLYLTTGLTTPYNEIGIAFSNDLEADSWDKFPTQLVKKPWPEDGGQDLGGGVFSWGVGQPSAVSLDRQGKILLTYTIGDAAGTRLVWVELDCSDMDNYVPLTPRTMVSDGLLTADFSAPDITHNSDFAIDPTNNKIVMVRPLHPNPKNDYPAQIEFAVEVDYMPLNEFLQSKGTWTRTFRITPEITGYPRNHNAGIERNVYGEIENWEEPVIYYTVSLAAPDVELTAEKMAEWTYHIWRGRIVKNQYYQ